MANFYANHDGERDKYVQLVSITEKDNGDLILRRYAGSFNTGEAIIEMSDPTVERDPEYVQGLVENYRTFIAM